MNDFTFIAMTIAINLVLTCAVFISARLVVFEYKLGRLSTLATHFYYNDDYPPLTLHQIEYLETGKVTVEKIDAVQLTSN